jgi:hypothetical protein
MRVRPPSQLLHLAAERRAPLLLSRSVPETASPLFREGEFVLDRLYAGNAARHLGGLGAGADRRHLTGQCDDTGVGADIHLLELRILAEAGLDGLRDALSLTSTAPPSLSLTSRPLDPLDPIAPCCRDRGRARQNWNTNILSSSRLLTPITNATHVPIATPQPYDLGTPLSDANVLQ